MDAPCRCRMTFVAVTARNADACRPIRVAPPRIPPELLPLRALRLAVSRDLHASPRTEGTRGCRSPVGRGALSTAATGAWAAVRPLTRRGNPPGDPPPGGATRATRPGHPLRPWPRGRVAAVPGARAQALGPPGGCRWRAPGGSRRCGCDAGTGRAPASTGCAGCPRVVKYVGLLRGRGARRGAADAPAREVRGTRCSPADGRARRVPALFAGAGGRPRPSSLLACVESRPLRSLGPRGAGFSCGAVSRWLVSDRLSRLRGGLGASLLGGRLKRGRACPRLRMPGVETSGYSPPSLALLCRQPHAATTGAQSGRTYGPIHEFQPSSSDASRRAYLCFSMRELGFDDLCCTRAFCLATIVLV